MKVITCCVLTGTLWVASLFVVPLLILWAYGLLQPLFHGPALTYWQAFAIWVVVSLIAGVFQRVKS